MSALLTLFSDVEDIFRALRVQVNAAGLAPNFLGMMQNLLCIPVQVEAGSVAPVLTQS